ncbi:hypothetical protein BU23DRAFT_555366 [Bimuria novae-zelandiae CBS 107.79]|uniref:Snf7-domain-containing protein n=1 Tax=Bimuria novae-zelandiae CBS 107.79 TaxID=1447943 RepID=A0A6A5VAS2_9PLEO|nr:hypothetical protein BU23DRAFT_555366 [Bimuria novae-zelandiae CBS 107.79]
MTELVEYIYTHEEAFKNQNRIASLYSDFRGQRDTNPDGYLANLNAWRKALEHATRAGVVPGSGTTKNLLIIDTSNEFARALQHKQYGLPTCLREVFLDAIKKGAFVPVPDWTTSTQSIYHKSWFTIPKIPTVGGVLSGAWEIGKSSIFGPSTQLPAGSFVVVANVEAVAEAILNDYRSQPHTSTADRIFSKTAFWKRFGDAPSTGVAITARDLDVLLVHMSRDKQVLSVSGNTIKFKAETEDQPSPVVQEDEAIAELHDAIETAKKRLVLLQANATKFGLAAKEAVQIKQIVRAKTCLRRKKMAETSLEHYTNLSLQLEESYSKLQQAADQVGIIEAMKAGAEAMATLNLKVGGVEGVQKVVDAVNEEMATTDEITNIINESADPVDEEEIDDELAEMERTEKEKKEREDAARAAERLAELPEAKKARIEEGHEAAKATESPADARQEREGEDLETDEIASQLSTVDIREPQEKKSEERVPMAA